MRSFRAKKRKHRFTVLGYPYATDPVTRKNESSLDGRLVDVHYYLMFPPSDFCRGVVGLPVPNSSLFPSLRKNRTPSRRFTGHSYRGSYLGSPTPRRQFLVSVELYPVARLEDLIFLFPIMKVFRLC